MLEIYRNLFQNGQIPSDCRLEMDDGTIFNCHRQILAMHSPVFARMLLGNHFKEGSTTNQTIKLPGKQTETFEMIFQYCYNGKIDNLDNISMDLLIDLLNICHEYDFSHLIFDLSDLLASKIDIGNVLEIFDRVANFLGIQTLIDQCLEIIDANANQLLMEHPGAFSSISRDSFEIILKRDSFAVLEKDICYAVADFIETNSKLTETKSLINLIRFHNLNLIDRDLARLFDKLDISWPYERGDGLAQPTRVIVPTKKPVLKTSCLRCPIEESLVLVFPKPSLISNLSLTFSNFYEGGWKCPVQCTNCKFEECRCAPQYKFTIEHSIGCEKWEKIVEENECYRKGQLLIKFEECIVKKSKFSKRNILKIDKFGSFLVRIKATGEIKGKPELRIDNFECPAQCLLKSNAILNVIEIG